MIWDPGKTIANGTKGAWQGPCWDLPEFFAKCIAPIWPEEQWVRALSVPMAEAGLTTRRPGLIPVRVPAVWTGTLGDMHLVNDLWGFSYGSFQLRHERAKPVPPVEPVANSKAAHQHWEKYGWGRWPSVKHGRDRVWFPASHRTIADYLETKP